MTIQKLIFIPSFLIITIYSYAQDLLILINDDSLNVNITKDKKNILYYETLEAGFNKEHFISKVQVKKYEMDYFKIHSLKETKPTLFKELKGKFQYPDLIITNKNDSLQVTIVSENEHFYSIKLLNESMIKTIGANRLKKITYDFFLIEGINELLNKQPSIFPKSSNLNTWKSRRKDGLYLTIEDFYAQKPFINNGFDVVSKRKKSLNYKVISTEKMQVSKDTIRETWGFHKNDTTYINLMPLIGTDDFSPILITGEYCYLEITDHGKDAMLVGGILGGLTGALIASSIVEHQNGIEEANRMGIIFDNSSQSLVPLSKKVLKNIIGQNPTLLDILETEIERLTLDKVKHYIIALNSSLNEGS